jgi:Putative amidoligase enzyme
MVAVYHGGMTTTRAQSDARHIQAAQMRAAGYTLAQVGTALGLTPRGARHAAWHGNQLLAEQNSAEAYWMRRRFGIEVEHCGLSERSGAAALRDAGLEATAPGYTHQVLREWKVVPDSTCGSEAVSPILRGKDGWEQVKTAMAALRAAGGSVNRRCGMHVHLDMSDMDGHQIARLVELYVEFQSEIDAFVAPSRRSTVSNQWCQPWYSGSVTNVCNYFRSHGTCMPGVDRYRTINVASYTKYGTVEVRQHQGSLNAATAKAWGMLLMALVEVARTDRVGEVEHGDGFLVSVAQVVNMPQRILRSLESRKARLAVQSTRVAW